MNDQLSLGLDVFGGRPARRVALDDTSWIDHVPRWLDGADALCRKLAADARWEHRQRWMIDKMIVEPRLTAEYTDLSDCPFSELPAIAGRLSALYDTTFERAWLSLYRDERDSTSWHADRPACLLPTSAVPVLSLGETRRFLVRRTRGGPSHVFLVESGDLVVMGGRCQRDWVHAVPKETTARGARISINFATRSARGT